MIEKVDIIWIRHGEVAINKNTKICPTDDMMVLNKEAKIKAEQLANFFKTKKRQIIFSSPLKRSLQTAKSLCVSDSN